MPINILCGSFHTHLQILSLDETTSKLDSNTLQAQPFKGYTWIVQHPLQEDLFYAAQAVSGQNGNLAVFKLSKNGQSPADWTFDILQTVSTQGQDPCHVGLSKDGDVIAVTNYDGSCVLTASLKTNGTIDQTTAQTKKFQGSGPKLDRQEAAHPHGAFWHSGWNAWLVTDLGSDKVRIIRKGEEIGSFDTRAGDGPRHLVLTKDFSACLVADELANTVTLYKLSSKFEEPYAVFQASEPVLPNGTSEADSAMKCSAILLSNDDKFVYITNRDQDHSEGDAIVYFALDDGGKGLKRIGETRTGLKHPRGAELVGEDGKFLITGTRTDNGAVVYARDGKTGHLKEVARNNNVVMPSCFVEA